MKKERNDIRRQKRRAVATTAMKNSGRLNPGGNVPSGHVADAGDVGGRIDPSSEIEQHDTAATQARRKRRAKQSG